MNGLRRITERDLRGIASEATSMHLADGVALNDAVVKVASAFDRPLSSEHVRRVCEMTYHDTYERSFRKQAGAPSRVVNFDPPDAEKVAGALRANHIKSYKNSSQVTRPGPGSHVKAASAFEIPEAPNAFSAAMSKVPNHDESELMETRHLLKTASQQMKDAVEQLQREIGSAKTAEHIAYLELGKMVRQAVIDGTPGRHVLDACEYYMKEASIPHSTALSVLSDLTNDMVAAGVDTWDKTATAEPNMRHPLNQRVVKVANLRFEKRAREIALTSVRIDEAQINNELQRFLHDEGTKLAGKLERVGTAAIAAPLVVAGGARAAKSTAESKAKIQEPWTNKGLN